MVSPLGARQTHKQVLWAPVGSGRFTSQCERIEITIYTYVFPIYRTLCIVSKNFFIKYFRNSLFAPSTTRYVHKCYLYYSFEQTFLMHSNTFSIYVDYQNVNVGDIPPTQLQNHDAPLLRTPIIILL